MHQIIMVFKRIFTGPQKLLKLLSDQILYKYKNVV